MIPVGAFPRWSIQRRAEELCDVAYIGADVFAEDRTRSMARRARSSAIDTTFGGHALDLRDGRPEACRATSRAALSFATLW